MSTIVRIPSQQNRNFGGSPSGIDIRGLKNCIQETRQYSQLQLANIAIPNNFQVLMKRLREEKRFLPSAYQRSVADPLIQHLQKRKNEGKIFNGSLSGRLWPIENDAIRAIFFHTGKCIYQSKEHQMAIRSAASVYTDESHSYCRTTRAAQEMVSDLYDGMIQHTENAKIKIPEASKTAPLHTWGTKKGAGPFTRPIDATRTIGLRAPIVNLPLEYTEGGLLAWTTLAHEVSGHDVLHAEELLPELKKVVSNAILKNFSHVKSSQDRYSTEVSYSKHLAEFWSKRMDETASDVLGLLNLGPAAGMGLIGYFRALYGKLGLGRPDGSDDGKHPVGILRGLLAAEVVRRLPFSKSHEWSQLILQETLKDYPRQQPSQRGMTRSPGYEDIPLEGVSVPYAVVRQSVSIVAEAIMNTPLNALTGEDGYSMSIAEIRVWSDHDEGHVANIQTILKGSSSIEKPYPANDPGGYFAEHVVAAATVEGLKHNANIPRIFDRMIDMLEAMNRFNPEWKDKKFSEVQCHRTNSFIDHEVSYPSSYPYEEEETVSIFTACFPRLWAS